MDIATTQSCKMVLQLNVHGTWSQKNEFQRQWWQHNSNFSNSWQSHQRNLDRKNHVEEIEWSGGNSDIERQKAAQYLADKIENYSSHSIHIVAHSHGGNVVLDAIDLLRRKFENEPDQGKLTDSIVSIITVGTPFLQKKKSFFRRIGYLGVLASVVIPPFIALLLINQFQAPFAEVPTFFDYAVGTAIVACALYSFLYFYKDAKNYLRLNKTRERQNFDWLYIYHKNDEAISALLEAKSFRLNYFTSKMVKSRLVGFLETFYIRLLSLYVIIVPILFAVFYFVKWDINELARFSGLIAVLGVLSFPILIVFFHLFFSILGLPVSAFMDRMVSSVLRSSALGEDSNSSFIDVTLAPSNLIANEYEISGELHDLMISKANQKLEAVINDSRETVFNAHSGLGFATFFELEAMASEGLPLIHTSYFDYSAIIDEIIDFQESSMRYKGSA